MDANAVPANESSLCVRFSNFGSYNDFARLVGLDGAATRENVLHVTEFDDVHPFWVALFGALPPVYGLQHGQGPFIEFRVGAFSPQSFVTWRRLVGLFIDYEKTGLVDAGLGNCDAKVHFILDHRVVLL